MLEKNIDGDIVKAIKTIDFVFNEYEYIYNKTGLIEITTPNPLKKEQRDAIKNHYELKNDFVRVEPVIVVNPEEKLQGYSRGITRFIFRKNN